MDFEDQDWVQGPAAEHDEGQPSAAWKVATGVVAGIVIGATAMYVAQHPATAVAWHEAARALDRTIAGADTAPTSWPAPARPPAVASEGAPAGPDRPPASALGVATPRPAAASALTSAALGRGTTAPAPLSAQEQHERRERAWARYYRKPVNCDERPTADTMIECANHYIRSRRQFDEAYAAGKL